MTLPPDSDPGVWSWLGSMGARVGSRSRDLGTRAGSEIASDSGMRMPSMRQSGRNTRPICGAAESRAANSGVDRRWMSWLRAHAASDARRTSQPKLRGRRGEGGRGRDVTGRRGRARAGRVRVPVPARTRAAKVAKRLAMRRSLVQIRMTSGPSIRRRPPLAAIARHSPSMMRAKLSSAEGGARGGEGCTNGTRT